MAKAKAPELPYSYHVFINCPFDAAYKPLFYATIFAIHDAGFVARCALEAIDSGDTRLAKITRIIEECKYGLHDISRTETSATTGLPRFNMPYECGLFWGCLRYGKPAQRRQKRLLVEVYSLCEVSPSGSEATGLLINRKIYYGEANWPKIPILRRVKYSSYD